MCVLEYRHFTDSTQTFYRQYTDILQTVHRHCTDKPHTFYRQYTHILGWGLQGAAQRTWKGLEALFMVGLNTRE